VHLGSLFHTIHCRILSWAKWIDPHLDVAWIPDSLQYTSIIHPRIITKGPPRRFPESSIYILTDLPGCVAHEVAICFVLPWLNVLRCSLGRQGGIRLTSGEGVPWGSLLAPKLVQIPAIL